jgi:hypothetical protein
MISNFSGLKIPSNPQVKIWRYMDMAKFLSLITNKSLYFARADNIGDPFEGSSTYLNANIADHFISAKKAGKNSPYADLDDQKIRNLYKQINNFAKNTIKQTYVSCWHMNEFESAAMWKLYSQANEAICIQSTFDKLANTLPSWVSAGTVHYIDYEKDYIPDDAVLNRLMRKRKSFEHERELRAVAWELISPELGGDEIRRLATEFGISVEVDVSELIETVYISPTSASWFLQLVEQLVSDYGYKFPVKRSSLIGTPLF